MQGWLWGERDRVISSGTVTEMPWSLGLVECVLC